MAPKLSPGTTFAGYQIEDVAGSGGMGIVYKATQLALGRRVALKLIAADLAANSSFQYWKAAFTTRRAVARLALKCSASC